MKALRSNLLLIIFVYTCIELLSLLAMAVAEHNSLFFSELFSRQKKIALNVGETVEDEFLTLPSVIHPYLGFVFNPDFKQASPYMGGFRPTDYGFFDHRRPLRSSLDDTIVVGVFGGSVAWLMTLHSTKLLVKELKKSPYFADKKIDVVRLALGSFKQPQQMMTLTYLLALGGHFDVIINLDGFNDIVMPYKNNLSHGVNPFFPSIWEDLMMRNPSRNELLATARIANLTAKRASFANLISSSIMHYSAAANAVWLFSDRYFKNELSHARYKLQTLSEGSDKLKPYAIRGAAFQHTDESNSYRKFAKFWRKCSLLMHSISQAHDIRYFHFLQPNQYVPNSKPFTKKEKEIAYDENSDWEKGVINGYKYLRAGGKKLKAAGVRFTDLTMMFSETKDHVYNDNCCHLNALGNDILAKEIAKEITYSLEHE